MPVDSQIDINITVESPIRNVFELREDVIIYEGIQAAAEFLVLELDDDRGSYSCVSVYPGLSSMS